ncbi:UTP--glucose-1-phosphate uridylyltransferase [bacterium]|nr:UTP--glucose-1-phosphate uridylyltransferase [bacterium]
MKNILNAFFNEAELGKINTNIETYRSYQNFEATKQTFLTKLPIYLDKMTLKKQSIGTKLTFSLLYLNYLFNPEAKIEWSKINPLNISDEINYDDLKKPDSPQSILKKIAVLKLNGGLGTSMGCVGPKSLVPIFKNKNFLTIIQEQLSFFESTYKVKLPLILLNSFNTHSQTERFFKKENKPFNAIIQNQFPKINKQSGEPFTMRTNSDQEWNPPGHGDVFLTLNESGWIDKLINDNKEYIFISNSDNIGATIDIAIPNYMSENNVDFLMETTKKTKLDVKGGTLVRVNNKLTLLERAQVETEHLPEFENIQKFKIFNTNNIWINLKQLKRKMEKENFLLPLIANPKTINNTNIIQLETAMGAAINLFDNAITCVVPRTRFLPVKKTSDLMLLRSDFLIKENNTYRFSEQVDVNDLPSISLGKEFDTVEKYENRVLETPSLKTVKSLKIEGNVHIEKNVTFSGNVSIKRADQKEIRLKNEIIDETTSF